MFHPAKVSQVLRIDDKTVFGTDKSVQAVLFMWDDNLVTVDVEPQLGEKIREGDIVLVDYSPKYSTIPVPKQSVVKLLRGAAAKQLWNSYQERNKKRKPEVPEEEMDRMPMGGLHVR
ncbi:MAG: hypothetical protein Q7R47_07095 [Candidatus Diapherotrites archaeon]|nr:hypothetical protein [Candidatus Diapherotrites archaeon]